MNAFIPQVKRWKTRTLLNVHKNCALSDLQKRQRQKKKIYQKSFESFSGLHVQVFPLQKAEQCRRPSVCAAANSCCLWKHPSLMRNSLYAGSINRQIRRFFLSSSFSSSEIRLSATCPRPLCASWTFSGVWSNSITWVWTPQTSDWHKH